MKKKNKLKVIKDAFLEDSPLSEEILEFRRKACATCPYNSKNVKDKSLMQGIRDSVTGGSAYCTICKCEIEQKTKAPTEYCALKSIGKEPLWNAMLVETDNVSDLNLINGSPELINVDLDESGTFFVLDFGEIDRSKYAINQNTKQRRFNPTFKFGLTSEKIISIYNVNVSCGCVKPTYVKEGNLYNFTSSLNIDLSGLNTFSKTITVFYKQQKGTTQQFEHKSVNIRLKGKVV